MEFKFNINDVFQSPIVEINQNLVPPGFKGDRRQLWEVVNKVSEVVNALGEASAAAQGLSKPITTADRLRNSDQTVYLLVDNQAQEGKGAITGMLKTGKKGLYVFDRNGQHYQVTPPCVLDFYVHESKQRQGLGKQLFEHMLEKEKVEPVKMAIDRPSDKLLGFLNKHYGLQGPVKQMNNFVVFDEFFPKPETKDDDDSNRAISSRTRGANGLQSSPASSSSYGRYGAPRPPCSMGQIIHNQTSVLSRASEPAGLGFPGQNYSNVPYQRNGLDDDLNSKKLFVKVPRSRNASREQLGAGNQMPNENTFNILQHVPKPPIRNTQTTNSSIRAPQTLPEKLGKNEFISVNNKSLYRNKQLESDVSQNEENPKLERPSSLSLPPNEEQEEGGTANGEVQNAEEEGRSAEKEDEENVNENVENDVEKLSLNDLQGSKNEDERVEIDGKTTPNDSGRKTPSGLTAQGYFDLKFYHSRLW